VSMGSIEPHETVTKVDALMRPARHG